MLNGRYRHLDEVPDGYAREGLVEGCMVLEGGAFRGLYTEGFLDVLMLSGINLSCVIGVSAGALGGMNYVSGQVGRSARINLGHRHDPRYVGALALAHSGSILDVGYITEDRGILEPFDIARFEASPMHFVAVATNCLTGEPTYFEKGGGTDMLLATRASATMPYLSPTVDIDGTPYLDGACSCKIPYEWALGRGYDKIVVVRTRERAYRREVRDAAMARAVYRAYPALVRSLEGIDADYNRQCDELEALHDEGRLYHVTPSEPVVVSRIESDMDRLGDLYWLGCHDAFACMDELRAYLGA
jgi:predicted patatin/cPLA2 family phospholipase